MTSGPFGLTREERRLTPAARARLDALEQRTGEGTITSAQPNELWLLQMLRRIAELVPFGQRQMARTADDEEWFAFRHLYERWQYKLQQDEIHDAPVKPEEWQLCGIGLRIIAGRGGYPALDELAALWTDLVARLETLLTDAAGEAAATDTAVMPAVPPDAEERRAKAEGAPQPASADEQESASSAQSQSSSAEKLVSLKDAAEQLKVSDDTIRRGGKKGTIRLVRVNQKLFMPLAELERLRRDPRYKYR